MAPENRCKAQTINPVHRTCVALPEAVISVITSVYRKIVFEQFRENVGKTIGVPYEIIAIDNSEGRMGLCEVYNKGAQQAQYNVLCYAHEDILLQTPGWGRKVTALFDQHPQLGLLGVAGSSYKSLIPSGWSFPTAEACTMYSSYIQCEPAGVGTPINCYHNPDQKSLSRVVSVDGMWFCTKRHIAREVKFDETLFKRFHCYDVDFSLAVYQKYQVAVTFDICVEHYSGGSFNAEWVLETLKLHRKWRTHLPVNLAGLDAPTQKSQEVRAFYFFLSIFAPSSIPVQKFIASLQHAKLVSILGLRTFVKLNLKIIKDRLMSGKRIQQQHGPAK